MELKWGAKNEGDLLSRGDNPLGNSCDGILVKEARAEEKKSKTSLGVTSKRGISQG